MPKDLISQMEKRKREMGFSSLSDYLIHLTRVDIHADPARWISTEMDSSEPEFYSNKVNADERSRNLRQAAETVRGVLDTTNAKANRNNKTSSAAQFLKRGEKPPGDT